MPLWLSRGIDARWHRTTKSVNQLQATIADCLPDTILGEIPIIVIFHEIKRL